MKKGFGSARSLLSSDENNLFISKKGLSEIVATLLIILVTLIAIGVIWVVVKNVIQKGADEIDLSSNPVDLKIESVVVDGDAVTVTVVVRRSAGEANFTGMDFVFSDGSNTETIRENSIINELDVKSFVFTLTKINGGQLNMVSIVPVYVKNGKETKGSIADNFDVKKNQSVGTTTGAVVVNNFEALGYAGAGKKEYGAFSSETYNPIKFLKEIVDPLDVLPGMMQTYTIHVFSPYSIYSVSSVTELDNSVSTLNFSRIGTDPANSSIEIWSVTWNVTDVHGITYRSHITAKDMQGNENQITLTWTDSCQAAIGSHGADRTVSSSCSTGASTVVGLDGGSVTIASGVSVTIDSGATWGFNSGRSFIIDGSVTVNGQISKTNLYYTDSDGDGRAASTTLNTASGVRASQALSTSDCSDSNSTLWTTGYGRDGDGDGYGSQGSSGCNNGASPFTATSGASDCNDGSASFWYNGYGHDSDGDFYGSSSLGCNNGVQSSLGVDCSPNDGTIFKTYGLNYKWDIDHDGYSSETTQGDMCLGETVVTGGRTYYREGNGFHWLATGQVLGTDCNNANEAVWYNGYTDSDGDGVGTGSLSCNNGPATNTDCNDASASYWYIGYTDSDGDGYGGATTTCNNGPQSNNDCDDGNVNAYYYGYAPDNDNDGYGDSYGCNNGLGQADCDDQCPTKPDPNGCFEELCQF